MSKPQLSDAVLVFLQAYESGNIKNININFDADFVNPALDKAEARIKELEAKLKHYEEIALIEIKGQQKQLDRFTKQNDIYKKALDKIAFGKGNSNVPELCEPCHLVAKQAIADAGAVE